MSIVLQRGSCEEIFLENAAFLRVTDEGILVNKLFEEPKLIEHARVTGIDFLQGRVTVTTMRGKDADGT
jgi:predicted RNA-binding protein